MNDLLDHAGLYDESSAVLDEQLARVSGDQVVSSAGLVWEYRPVADEDRVDLLVAVEGAAPDFDEGRWREDMRAHGATEDLADELLEEVRRPGTITAAVVVSRDDAARAVLIELEERRTEREAPIIECLDALDRQRDREISDYAKQLRLSIEAAAAREWPNLDLDVTVVDPALSRVLPARSLMAPHDSIGLELLHAAVDQTPLPGSGLRPGQYPRDGRPLEDHEREAGRLPHLRLQVSTTAVEDSQEGDGGN